MGIRDNITVKETSEAGDIARSLEGVIKSQFISKEFDDVITSTIYTRYECQAMAEMWIIYRVSRIYRITEENTKDATLSEDEKKNYEESWILRKAMDKSPHVANEIISYAFMMLYSMALQSLEGLSRNQGVAMVSGATQKILGKDDLSMWEKTKRRIMGSGIAFTG